MSEIVLSGKQVEAVDAIWQWFIKHSKQVFTLGGYAGTGKTTLLAHFRKKLYQMNKDFKVAFCSYTGKATIVLQSTLEEFGVTFSTDSVSTIHSLIYTPIINDADQIIGWERKDALHVDLIIVDEASMVDRKIFEDLRYYGIPILAVGDHGQLPPINGKFNLMENPDFKLEEIFRQAEDNPIIRLSVMARKEGHIPPGVYADTVIKFDRYDSDIGAEIQDLLEGFDDDTLVLCGYNYTRVRLNKQIRSILQFEKLMPTVGDRVICLRNNHAVGIFNGMIGVIQQVFDFDEKWYKADILMNNSLLYSGLVLKEQFNANRPLNQTNNRKKTLGGDLFDFGYAITVHKAQGSQAKKVILFEQRFSRMDDDMWRRWLYTAVTRAQEKLFIVG